jgi:hypothetical protein
MRIKRVDKITIIRHVIRSCLWKGHVADQDNMSTNRIVEYTFFAYGHGLHMRREDKRPVGRSSGERKEKADSQAGARRPNRRSIRLPGYDYSRA